MRCCSAYVSEGFDEVPGMAASLDLSPFSLYLEQPRQSGGGREEKWCGWPCAQVLSWKSHSPVPHQMALQLAHTPPRPSSVCLLAWCGFAAPLSTSTAERTDFQGFGTTSTRWAGPLQLQPAGHVGSPSSTQTKTTRRARDDDAIAHRPRGRSATEIRTVLTELNGPA